MVDLKLWTKQLFVFTQVVLILFIASVGPFFRQAPIYGTRNSPISNEGDQIQLLGPKTAHDDAFEIRLDLLKQILQKYQTLKAIPPPRKN